MAKFSDLRVGEVNILKLVLGNLEGGSGVEVEGCAQIALRVRTTGIKLQ